MQLRMVIATILVFLGIPCLAADAVRKTNVVFILTDNQGAWTLGCYGNPDIQTPHIDRLAADGMLFSRAFASNAVCSPTRATYLTGLIPSQHGVHCFLDPKYMMGPEAYNTLAEFRSLPEILADHGYVCGLTGKWHLGANLTPQESFSYWITMVQGSTAEGGTASRARRSRGRSRAPPAARVARSGSSAGTADPGHYARAMTRVLVLNGPNLGRLGTREPEVYGSETLADLAATCARTGADLDLEVETRQTDDEATLLGWLHEAVDSRSHVVLNPAAFTHYSYAVRDACAQVTGAGLVLVEVHLSNPAARETFRHTSVVAGVSTGTVAGFGLDGYRLALRAIAARTR